MISALILTLIIETLVLFLLKYRNYKIYIICLIINIITNLSLNYYLIHTIFQTVYIYIIVVILLEAFIWIVEGLVYMIYLKDFKKAIKVSIILNATSFFTGLLLTFIGIPI